MHSAHFSEAELECHCGCGQNGCQQALIDGLEGFRMLVGGPVIVDDAYRCPTHNAAVGGVPKSQHELGLAADVRVEGKWLEISILWRVRFRILGASAWTIINSTSTSISGPLVRLLSGATTRRVSRSRITRRRRERSFS